MKRTRHTVETTDGVSIAFEHYSVSEQGTAIVICPGFFKSKNAPIFQQIASDLAVLCDVICMDFRGHGDSSGGFTFFCL